jgi:hypothetical protein
MAERRTFRENIKNVVRTSAQLLKKLSPERAVSKMKLNRELIGILNSRYLHGEEPNWERVKELVAAGANPNIYNQTLMTSLHYAAYSGRTDICAFLLANGANLNAKNESSKTALQVAQSVMDVSRHSKEWQKIVDFLFYARFLSKLIDKESFKAFLPSFAECVGL